MKQILRTLSILCLVLTANRSLAQCGAGYTQAQLNWDKLDYYYNSGSNVTPYGFSTPSSGNYVTNTMEQTQKFAIGPNYVTIVTSAAGIVDGENASHTGDIAGYTGDDAQFTPSAASQTIQMTFNTVVQNLAFTLYDIDASARIDIDAYDASNVLQSVTITLQGTTILSRTNGTAAFVSANSTALANTDNRGTATITVSSSVKKVVITCTTLGSDAVFWMSDINACVSGSFPTNYQQTGSNRPLQGPAGNQPDYFLITPDNTSVYMVDPATGKAWWIFSDPEFGYVNSLAYDPYKHILYYVTEHFPAVATNKKLKKYDFATGTISTVFNDITTALNIPTFDQSIEGAGASFYNGQLYLGIEGGKYSNTVGNSRESIIYRIDFDASGNAINAAQVFSVPCYNGSTMLHDWADFVVKDGVLVNYNSQTGTTKVSYEHYDMITGASTKYMNPGSTAYASQAGMDWSGNLYSFFTNGVGRYFENGTIGAITPITAVTGGPWPGGAGDASENFRPMVDFGDAPSTYDPNPLSPASHNLDANLRLGSSSDKEWVTRGQSAPATSDNFDDGLPFVSTFNPNVGNYATEVFVYNNTGANATVCAWLDYNANGVFDASEGVSITVGSSASVQSKWLFWPSISSSLSIGSSTYLRIRVTYASNGMTTSNPTGYYDGGEVEDFRVPVNQFALAIQSNDFNAQLTSAKTVKLTWSNPDVTDVANYLVERSQNSVDWAPVNFASPKGASGNESYAIADNSPLTGISYYRLKTTQKDGKVSISQTRKIDNNPGKFSITIAPNPARSAASMFVTTNTAGTGTIEMLNNQGAVVYQDKIKVLMGTNSIALPVAKLSSGQYIVRVSVNNEVYSQSLIINK